MSAATPSTDPSADLARRLASLLRIGKVAAVNHGEARVRVTTGGLETDWLPWATLRAGNVRHWSPPSVGEQVMVLAPSGEMEQAVVMTGLFQSGSAAPESSGDVQADHYPDGAIIRYNHASGHLEATGVKTATLQASGSITVDCPDVVFTGNVDVQGNMSSHGVVLHTHIHGGVASGSAVTAGPQ